MGNYNEHSDLLSIIDKRASKIVEELLRKNKIITVIDAEVATVDGINNTATVKFLGDSTNESGVFKNKTGVALNTGDYVEIWYKYGTVSQGYIMIKR